MIQLCPKCRKWHESHSSNSTPCDRCMDGASLAVLWWFVAFAVVAVLITAWFCWKGFNVP